LTLGYVTLLKLVVGRPAPRDDYVPSVAPDEAKLSRTFRPGLYRGGVIAGWPSGHVAVTTAMLASLAAYYPDSWLLKLALVVGSAGMMLGVSSFEAGGMHWASDAVAGALLALPIGLSTGQGMRRLVDGKKARSRSGVVHRPVAACRHDRRRAWARVLGSSEHRERHRETQRSGSVSSVSSSV
jgi:membrane-associated phospholipid phosphatase